jgi:hypothetical protein
MLIAAALGLALMAAGHSRLGGTILIWGMVGPLGAQGFALGFVVFKLSRRPAVKSHAHQGPAEPRP